MRFFIVIQYVQLVPFARSTETVHSICGAPERGVVGTTYQMMCLVAGQLKVNQRLVSLAARLPVNWVPVVMVVNGKRVDADRDSVRRDVVPSVVVQDAIATLEVDAVAG